MAIRMWSSNGGREQPGRLAMVPVGHESKLRDWIAQDPDIVTEGLTMLGKEVHLDAARRVDLLAIDSTENLVVVELKIDRGTRYVVAQTLDYVATLAAMPEDALRRLFARLALDPDRAARVEPLLAAGRPAVGIAVGVGERDDLTRITTYLSEYNVPIRHISLDVFQAPAGDLLLVRHGEAANLDDDQPVPTRSHRPAVHDPADLFDDASMRAAIATLDRATSDAGLHRRLYPRAVMWSPPAHKARMLMTLSASRPGGTFYCSADTFAEFYGTDPDAVSSVSPSKIEGPTADNLLAVAHMVGAWVQRGDDEQGSPE